MLRREVNELPQLRLLLPEFFLPDSQAIVEISQFPGRVVEDPAEMREFVLADYTNLMLKFPSCQRPGSLNQPPQGCRDAPGDGHTKPCGDQQREKCRDRYGEKHSTLRTLDIQSGLRPLFSYPPGNIFHQLGAHR